MGALSFVILVEDCETGGGPSLVAVRIEYSFAYQFCYWELWMENLWGAERKNYFVNFFLRGCFQCWWLRVGVVGFIHQSAVTNSIHLQSTYTLHFQYLQSEAHLESSRTSAVELFCRNSKCVKAVGYFRRRAPSCIFDRMFDRILNATLPNNLL